MAWHNSLGVTDRDKIQPAFIGSGEDIPMTMQVGMIGSDGIVIAGDTKWTNEPMLVNRNWAGGRYGFKSTKMKVDHERGIAVACARDMAVSCWVAHQVLSIIRTEEYADPINAIVRIGNEIQAELKDEKYPAQCIIAFSRPSFALYLFQFGNVCGKWAPLCQRMDGVAVAGDNVNPAIFWMERYYKRVPVKELIPLAAHLVVSASFLSSATIGGLEIVVCDKSGPHLVPTNAIGQLEQKAHHWDEIIGEMFSSYGKQFSYVPDVIG